MKFGLENIARLCAALGHPERAFRSIVDRRHQRQGLGHRDGRARRCAPPGTATARYTSPHLVRLEERFVVDGAEVGTGDLRGAVARVQEAVEALLRTGAPRSAADVLRVRDGGRVRAVPAARVSTSRCSKSASADGSTPRTSSRRSRPRSPRSTSITRRSSATRSRRSRARRRASSSPASRSCAARCRPAADRVIRETSAERGARMVHAPDAVRMTARGDGAIDVATGSAASTASGSRCADAISRTTPRSRCALLDELARLGLRDPDAAVRTGYRRGLAGAARALRVDGTDDPPRRRAQSGRRAGAGRLSPRDRLDRRHAGLRRDAGQGRRRNARRARAPVRGHRLHDGAHARARSRRTSWRPSPRRSRPGGPASKRSAIRRPRWRAHGACGRTGRHGRFDLPDRSSAWYSSMTSVPRPSSRTSCFASAPFWSSASRVEWLGAPPSRARRAVSPAASSTSSST